MLQLSEPAQSQYHHAIWYGPCHEKTWYLCDRRKLTHACYSYQLVQTHLLSSAEHTYPPLAVAAIGYVVGACSIALVLPICSLGRSSWTFLADPMALGALAYAVFMTSAFNYALQAYANKHSSPTLVTAFFPMQIVFTALFSWIALGHVPQPSDYAGAAMIVGGLAAVTAGRWLHTRRAS